ncbi:nitrate/nitrite transporter [alpha proteobacterium HIMB114]|nr:nitrate/nitrite transporter [alpha proteobacterium HIMB114]
MFNFHFIKSNFKYLLFGFLMTFCSSFGQTFFLGIFNPFIRQDLNLSHSEFGGIYSIATLVSSLSIIWLGKKIDDFKLRNFAIFVCLSLFFASIFISQLSSLLHLIFALFFLRLFGQGLMSHTSSTAMAKFFNRNRGKALGIAWLGLTFGEGILPGLVILLLNFMIWKKVWIIIATFLFIFVMPLILYLLRDFKDNSEEPDQLKVNLNIKNWTRGEVLKDIKFYFLLPAVLCPPFLITGIFINQTFLFESSGWGISYIAPSFTAYAIFTLISLQVSGYLIDRFSAIKVLPFYLLPMITGFVISYLFQFSLSPVLFFIFIAITNGTANVLITSTWSEMYGTKHLGAIRSVTVALMVFSTSLSPILFGYLIDDGLNAQNIFLFMVLYAIFANLLFCLKIKSYKPVITA